MIKELSKKRSFIIILIILVILFIAFIIRPSVVGFSTYQKIKSSNYSIEDYGESIQELKSKLLICETNVSSCGAFNKELLTEFGKYSDKFAECNSELSTSELSYNLLKNKYDDTIENLKFELDKKDREFNKLINKEEEEINNLKREQQFLVKNVANNLCCKAKVDNPGINYYKIENNRIICLEEGTLSISCFGSK